MTMRIHTCHKSPPPLSPAPPPFSSLPSQTTIGTHIPILLKPLSATLKSSPKGFNSKKQNDNKKKKKKNFGKDYRSDDGDEDEDDGEEEEDGGVIPEIVTNRMMGRIAASVGIPLLTGLAFFPFFYYLKVVAKLDVPSWIPLIVSFFFFGTALLGVSYGIVSASWDPLREGSALGWNEAKKNWPVFWQSISKRKN